MHFHVLSQKPNKATKPFAKVIRAASTLIKDKGLPYRDITIPVTTSPISVASDGTARRVPAVVAKFRRLTWEKSGSMKR